jgi:hypothetical protein
MTWPDWAAKREYSPAKTKGYAGVLAVEDLLENKSRKLTKPVFSDRAM